MGILGFFTGDNDKITQMESLVNQGLYTAALDIDFNIWALSDEDYRKVTYLTALCLYKLEKFGDAQRQIVYLLNYPSGAGSYETKAKSLKKSISAKESSNNIKFPIESFRFFVDDCTSIKSEERRTKEGVSSSQYYVKIQLFDQETGKCFTFYWKPVSSKGNELFIYLGEHLNTFCHEIDEKIIERTVYTRSMQHIGKLYEKGRNGASFEPALYRTTDFTKPTNIFSGENTYVLGIKTFKNLTDDLEDLEWEMTQLLEAFGNILKDIDQEPYRSDHFKIYALYFAKGALSKVASTESSGLIKKLGRFFGRD